VAWAVGDGKEAFRVRLPVKDFDPNPIREVAGLFLVQTTESPDGKGAALIIDRKGRVRFRLDRQVVDGKRQGEDVVLLTSREVVRLSADGKRRWAAAFQRPEWIAGGGVVDLADGDVLAFLYCQIADSGVQVVRLEAATGKQVWRARCAPLGVGHSKYRHDARVAVEGDRVQVTSTASGGTFVEILDLQTGEQVKRMKGRD
jgi:hypothetical protein